MLLHILKRTDWERAKGLGEYRPDSLRSEGFVHCSTPAQAAAAGNRFFHGQQDLLLLCIDERRLAAPVRFEPAADADHSLFPHIYGPINLDSVVNVVDFPCREDGSFSLPQLASDL